MLLPFLSKLCAGPLCWRSLRLRRLRREVEEISRGLMQILFFVFDFPLFPFLFFFVFLLLFLSFICLDILVRDPPRLFGYVCLGCNVAIWHILIKLGF